MLTCNATSFVRSNAGLTTIQNEVVPPGTVTIRFESNSITSIYNTYFHNMSSLEYLWIQSNDISTIDDFSFIGVPTLKLILLKNNDLPYVGKNMFKGLFNLGMALHFNQIFHVCIMIF